MTDYDALHRAVVDANTDDTPRLVIADWMDDNAADVACDVCSNLSWWGNPVPVGQLIVEATPGVNCPLCGTRGVWRSGVHFDHERWCTNGECGTTWTPDETSVFAGRCHRCKGSGRLSNTFAEWAEFIRVGVALARFGPKPDSTCCVMSQSPDHWCAYQSWHEKHPEANRLQKRETELFDKYKIRWFGGDSWAIYYQHYDREHVEGQYPNLLSAGVSRGFVSELMTPFSRFLGGQCVGCHGVGDDGGRAEEYTVCPTCRGSGEMRGLDLAQVFSAHPIEAVYISDKAPSEWSAGNNADQREWVWERSMTDQPNPEDFHYLGSGPFNPNGDEDAAVLPPDVFDEMSGESGMYYFVIGKHGYRRYPTREAAVEDLSNTLVACGRKAAGLSP